MKIVIIEDEKLTAKDLAHTLKAVEPDTEIIALLYSVEESLAFFKQAPDVDLIFSDIELGDGLSFDIFPHISSQIPIVFCTAYAHYSLKAFNTLGIDFVVKPFNKDSIRKTFQKYRKLKDSFKKNDDNKLLLDTLKNNLLGESPSIIVHQGDRIIPVSGTDIALFYISNMNTYAFTFDQKKYLLTSKLEELENTFAPFFFRANRQFLINRKAVRDASYFFKRRMLANLVIAFPEQIVIGKLKTTAFIKWLSDKSFSSQ